MRRRFWLFASAMAAGMASTALAQTGDSYKVQPPELAAPERGSLAGSLSRTAFGPGDVDRGTFVLPSPYAAPEERGSLLAPVFPAYSPEAGISEWGMGWSTDLALTRWVASGTDVYASDDLTGPFGRCQKGVDGYWYPVGLSRLVRIEASGSGFVAYTGDGTRWRFGITTRVEPTTADTYAWYLDEVETVTGRKTALTYSTNASGRPFLMQVDYGGVGIAYEHRVTLDYVTLTKTFKDYRSGAALVLDRRVSGVSAWTYNSQAGAWQVRWGFTPSYRVDPVGPAFYLEQVQQTFASGEQPPSTRYTYELSSDALAGATLTRSTKFDSVVADYGATIVLPSYSTPVDAGADGLQDLEVASDNTLIVQGADGFSYQPLPPPSPSARSDCRAPASPFNRPRTLAAMRASSDEVQVVSLTATTSTQLLLCDRAGEPLFEKTLANVWTLGPKTRLVDLNRDHQPDLIQVYTNGYQVIPNTSTASGFSFGAPITGSLNLAFPFTGIWIYDFNGDGLPDIITRTSTVIVVYFGLGNFKFAATPQTYQVLNFQGVPINPSTYAFTWVDADGDGLADLVLSTTTSAFLFRNTGSAFVPLLVGGKTSIAASAYLPLFLDLNGSGNAEVFFILSGAGYSVPLNGPGTGLLQTADDGKGTVLRFAYRRADAAPGIGRRPAVLSTLTIESTGYDTVFHAFSYGTARFHSLGKFLLGFDQVTRTDPLLTYTIDFLNDDQFVGVVLGFTKRDALVPGLEQFEQRTYDDDVFQGIAWKRPREETSGWRGTVLGWDPPVVETTTYLAWDPGRTFCPATFQRTTASGTLTTEQHYVDRAAFGLALACLADSVVQTGTRGDGAFDFRETALTLNDKGLVENVESVSEGERLVLQSVRYNAEWRVETISSPGKGTSTFEWPAGTHLLRKVTLPDGSTVEAVERDPLTSAIRTLRTTHGTVSYDRFFRFDRQERLLKQWDTLGAATEANPNLLVRSYQYATATTPSSVYASTLVDASGSARDAVDLVTAAGELVTSATRIPEGWSFSSLVTRSRVSGETKTHVKPTVAATTDPAAMDEATLLSDVSELERSVAGPFGIVTDHTTKFHTDVEQRIAETVQLDPTFLLVKNARENDTYDRSWSVDAAGRVLAYSDEARGTYWYQYDAFGRLCEVTLSNGTKHRARYDGHGRVFRIERDDVATVEYAFDAVTGLLREKRFYAPLGTIPQRSVSYAYDAIGRLKTETHTGDDGATQQFTLYYDGATPAAPAQRTTLGFLTGASGPGFSKTFEYWPDGKLKARTVVIDGWRKVETTLTYTESRDVKQRTTRLLDALDLPLSTTAEVLTYDAYGRLASTTRDGAPFSTFGYDGNGILTSATFPGASLTLTPDGLTRTITGSTLAAGTAAASTTQRMSVRGLVEFETFAAGMTTQRRDYSYDPRRFLSGATGYGYEFDASGLPKSITTGTAKKDLVRIGNTLVAGTTTYTFDGLGRTTQRTDSAAPATNLTLTYGPDGQVATATKGSTTWSFVYDEKGQRIAKLLAGSPVALYVDEGYVDASGLTEPVKVAGRTVGLWKGGAFTPLATDLRGSVMAESGALLLASPFGQRDVHPWMAKVIDYVEKGFDADLGLVRMGVRDYDPEINRFTTPDPLFLEEPQRCVHSALECIMYAYALNRPNQILDPSGLGDPLDAVGPVIANRDYYWAQAAQSFRQGGALGVAGGIGWGIHWVIWGAMSLPAYVTQGVLEPINASALQIRGQLTGNASDFFEGNSRVVALQQTIFMSGFLRAASRPEVLTDPLISSRSAPARVEELLGMMNGRPGVTARLAAGDDLRYLKAMDAGGSHMLLEGGRSEILLRPDAANRWTAFHEWMHRSLQLSRGGPTPGEDLFIEGFLQRHQGLLQIEKPAVKP